MSRRPPSQSREVLQLLKALHRRSDRVGRDGHGGIAVPIDAGQITRRIVFPAAVVEAALRDDLLEEVDGGIGLSARGKAKLARAGAAAAPFLSQHTALSLERRSDGEGAVDVLVDQAVSPLAWLRRRRG